MKRDSHYYAILAFSRACGFKKECAHIIAYASQYVDDAKINLMYIDNPCELIEYDFVEYRPSFFNMSTCHSYFKINTFNYESMVNNTSAFHFVPGCSGDNFTKKLRCKEESPVILDILNDVISDDNLIKLGIALHAYADTFVHQGFSGMLSKVNDVKNCEPRSELNLGLLDKFLHLVKRYSKEKYDQLFDNVIPAYGHGLALDYPDIPYLVWSYDYDCSGEFYCAFKTVEIDNKERYKRAFNKLRIQLENYLKMHPHYSDPGLKFDNWDLLIEALLLQNTDRLREMNWVSIIIEQKLFDKDDLELIIYQDDKWLREAFSNYDPHLFNNREVDSVRIADNFTNSSWYHFYLAVKWYKNKFFCYCEKHGLTIPN